MDLWSALQIYLVVAIALAGTSYWNLYRPAMELLEEILEEEVPRYNGWWGKSMWLILSFILAPVTAVLLLSNNNNIFIERLAINLANTIIEEEDDENT